MKKIYIWVLAAFVLLSMTGCSSEIKADEFFRDYGILCEDIRDVTAPFAGEDGGISEPAEALDALEAFAGKAKGVSGWFREENSITLFLSSGIDVVYTPTQAEGPGESCLISWKSEDFKKKPESGRERSLAQAVQNQTSALPGFLEEPWPRATVEAMKELKPDSCVFFEGSGEMTRAHGSILDTADSPSEETIRKYYDDLVNKRLVIHIPGPEGMGVYAVTGAFFDSRYAERGLENCGIFLSAGCSAGDDGLRGALLRQGADVVIGAPEPISPSEGGALLRPFIRELTENSTFSEALEAAGREIGTDGFVLYGDEAFRPADSHEAYSYAAFYGGTDFSRVEDLAATEFKASKRSADYGYALYYGQAVLLDYTGHDREVILPDAIDGHPVAAVGQGCFRGCRDLERVVIPDACFYVHAYAFADCPNLREVVLGSYVMDVSRLAFTGSAVGVMTVSPGSSGERYCRGMGMHLENGQEQSAGSAYAGVPGEYRYREREIIQACGPAVQEGGALYYWQYSLDSFASPYSGPRFPMEQDVENRLICRLPDGRERTLLEYPGQGNLALTRDRIFYTVPKENNRLYSCSYWGGEQKFYSIYGEIVYSDPKNDFLLLQGDSLSLFLPEQNRGGHLADGEFLGCVNHVAYVGRREEKALKILAVDLMANESWQVCEILTDDPAAYLTKVCVAGDKLYCGFGTMAENGLDFRGGQVLEADLRGGAVRARAELTGGGFGVEADGTVLTTGPATGAVYVRAEDRHFIEENGTVYRTELDNALAEPLLLPEDISALGLGKIGLSGSRSLTADWAARSGGKACALLEESVKETNGYTLVRLVMICKDLETGRTEILYDTGGEPVSTP